MARALRMLSDQQLKDVLSLQNLKLPMQPKVVEIRFEAYEEGSSEEESLDIYVIVEDGTPSDDLTWAKVQPIFESTRASLQEAGETRFPYFDIGTRAQYDRRFTYDPATDD